MKLKGAHRKVRHPSLGRRHAFQSRERTHEECTDGVSQVLWVTKSCGLLKKPVILSSLLSAHTWCAHKSCTDSAGTYN